MLARSAERSAGFIAESICRRSSGAMQSSFVFSSRPSRTAARSAALIPLSRAESSSTLMPARTSARSWGVISARSRVRSAGETPERTAARSEGDMPASTTARSLGLIAANALERSSGDMPSSCIPRSDAEPAPTPAELPPPLPPLKSNEEEPTAAPAKPPPPPCGVPGGDCGGVDLDPIADAIAESRSAFLRRGMCASATILSASVSNLTIRSTSPSVSVVRTSRSSSSTEEGSPRAQPETIASEREAPCSRSFSMRSAALAARARVSFSR
mmetsp:Transcript_84169/g.167991  ORF Transcript_84169/g.167991 Transcript_84169/m.167991 type:complete len:271 (-) Transcript_84169:1703-2515(-)